MTLNERCRCGRPADYRCESRKVGPVVATRGEVKQPYLEFFLCELCALDALQGSDPPRSAQPLPHQKQILKQREREAQKAHAGRFTEDRLGDWGRVDEVTR